MSIWVWILLAVYVIGIAVTLSLVKGWKKSLYEKTYCALLWPLAAILYGIHWLHMRWG